MFTMFQWRSVRFQIRHAIMMTPVADPENFGGGGFKHKTSKIRMSSPKLRLIFRSNVFFAQNQVVSKKKKKEKGLHQN